VVRAANSSIDLSTLRWAKIAMPSSQEMLRWSPIADPGKATETILLDDRSQ